MSTRLLSFGIGAVLILHNVLRVVASSFGKTDGIFNYLALVGLSKSTPSQVKVPGDVVSAVPLSPVLWVVTALSLAACGWAVWRSWQKPSEAQPLWASATLSALSAAAVGLLIVLVSINVEGTYGFALFVILPVLMGMQAALQLSRWRKTSIVQSLGVSALSVVLLGVLLLGIAVEGLICLVMAVPLAIPLAMLGGLAGYALGRSQPFQKPATFALIVGLSPFAATIERAIAPVADVYTVTTAIELKASPGRVWQAITEAATLPAPSEALFRTGIAYPRSSYIVGSGPDATRYCDFSTGKLVEPVLIWDYPKQLRFRVASNPLPMEEWTPYARIHPPHLDGFLVSKQGEYRLMLLASGGTRLEATTWYQHHLWPAAYWRVWSDFIIHKVHGMVLLNIRQRAES